MTDLSTLVAKDQIADCIHRLFVATDRRDWPTVRGCFAEVVRFDMTSLTGGTPADLSPKDITDVWDAGLRTIDHVHHQAGNLLIDVRGEVAHASCHGIALHHRALQTADNLRRFVGSYEFELRHTGGRWVIASFRFLVKFVDGNLTLEEA